MPELNETKPNVKFYLSNVDYGTQRLVPLEVLFNHALEKNKLLDVYSVVKEEGKENLPEIKNSKYVRSYFRFSDEQLKDEIEIIRYEIGHLLGLELPQVHRVYATSSILPNELKGIVINTNVDSNNKEITLSNNFSWIASNVQKGMYKNSYPEYRIVANKNGEPITNPTTLKIIVNKGLNAMPSPTLSSSKERLTKEYIRMILFDLIMNQVSRAGNDYSFYSTKGMERVKQKVPFTTPEGTTDYKIIEREVEVQKVYLIPGTGNYTFMSSTYSPNEYNLNDIVVSRSDLLNVLLTEYTEYVGPIIAPLFDCLDRYKECISKIIYNNTSKENAATIEEIIFANLDKVVAAAKENKLNEVDGNKVELASTTTRQSLAILKKEEELSKKYIENPRDVVEKPVIETDTRLKLKAELPKEKKSGYASLALVGSILAFVCGLGFGIAYVLMHMN